jgi:hypothetical protein
LVGLLEPEPIGSYVYQKDGFTCHVIVFLMEVTSEEAAWPEQSFRQRRWLSATKAAARVADPGLRALIEGAAVGRTV